ncbi:MAG: XdhC family protein [Gemmatimonadales bacterium]
MTTHRAIVDALALAADAGESTVLATVVSVTGSSYGGVGTRMVVRVDGSTVGVVSGGCIETDLAEHARDVHTRGTAKVVTYDTRGDEDAVWGLGLGCNGLIDVLLEPLPPPAAAGVAVLLEQALDARTPLAVATVVQAIPGASEPVVGAHALVGGGDIVTTGNWGDRSLLAPIASDYGAAIEAGRRGLVREYGSTKVAFEVVAPAVRLVICGSGPDVTALVRLGSGLGWNLTVVDHRPVEHAHPERFPGARVAECQEARRLEDAVGITPHTAAVVMSHHYARDLDYVRALLASEAAYIGVLGPRARAERMISEMGSNGEGAGAGERLLAPIGLDLGGEGPDAIGLAIIAEVSAVMNGRSGGHLRDRRAPLHSAAFGSRSERG